MKNINWKKYKFRASQVHKLMVGSLPNKNSYDTRINELINERDTLTNVNGRKVKWTKPKEKELNDLIEKKNTPYFQLLPKTMTTELRKIYRAEKYNRNFSFTNKYVQKGLAQEEEAISLYQDYLYKIKGQNTSFKNNKDRLENDYVSGEADLTDTNDFANCNEGYDAKCSWELETFPFNGDELDFGYEMQNQTYMWLSGAEKWITFYALVNVTEDLLHKEKMKWFYALGSPMDEDDKNYEDYIAKARELEVRLIFDYDRFIKENPGHQMEITRNEWFENGFDIPLKERIVEKKSVYNQTLIDDLKERIEVSREYLMYLDKQ